MDRTSITSMEHFLVQVERLIDWDSVSSRMHEVVQRAGRDVPLSALKLLLVARWYGMEDGSVEEALRDRLSFRRFVGLPLDRFTGDEQVTEAFRWCGSQAPAEVQALRHAIEAQLLASGFAVRSGMSSEASVVPITRAPAAEPVQNLAKTALFRPGQLAALASRNEGLIARGGLDGEAPLPSITDTGSLLTPPKQEKPAVRCSLEWPWGETTELTGKLNVGRDLTFSPVAPHMQAYRHVSRRHVELQLCDIGVWVRDLQSHNGTFVNDEEVPKGQAFLVDGDARLRCGPNFVVVMTLR